MPSLLIFHDAGCSMTPAYLDGDGARHVPFEVDPEALRDQDGEVDEDWAQEARRKLEMELA